MIYIFYGESKIPAENDGTPINPPGYWTPEILEGIAQAFADGHWEPVPEPTPPPPEPDWVGFNVAMRGCSSFQTWFGFLSPLDQQAVVATSVNANAPALQVAIAMAAASVPYSPASGEEWAGIASQYGIPLTL